MKTNTAQKLINEIVVLRVKLEKLQEKCLHPAKYIEINHDTDIDNFSPNDSNRNYFFTNLRCSKCQNKWKVEGFVCGYIDKNTYNTV